MNSIKEALVQINVADLIKIFNFQIAIAVFLVFIIFRKLFAQVILKIFFALIKNNKKNKIKETTTYKVLSSFFIFLGVYFAIKVLKLTGKTVIVVDTIFKAICLIYIARFINSFINQDEQWFKRYRNYSNNDMVNKLICKILRIVVWTIMGYIVIKELGYDLTGLVAGLGVGSVIISFAAQDTVKSLLSGAVILTDRPFDIGDFIEVGTFKGTVIEVTFRSTRIKALDNSIITIPNSIITGEYIVNWNKLTSRRFECILNMNMNTTSEKIKNVIEKIKLVLKNNPKIIADTVQVNFDSISSYSSDIKVFAYIDEAEITEYWNIREKIYCDILELVEKENIDLAYPTQTVYVKNSDI